MLSSSVIAELFFKAWAAWLDVQGALEVVATNGGGSVQFFGRRRKSDLSHVLMLFTYAAMLKDYVFGCCTSEVV